MNATAHPAVTRYLHDLERALRDIPRPRRNEIVQEIREHIEEASTSSVETADEVRIRTVLDQVGDPETIAEEARERFGIQRTKGGALEGFAIALILVGGVIVPVLGWIVGVVLLWVSRVWSTRDKLIGTFVVPGGLALPVYLSVFATVSGSSSCQTAPGSRGIMVETCTGGNVGAGPWLMVAVTVVVALLPVATSIYLGRRAFRR